MTSLYNRATPRQSRVLRIIEGAAVNAFHAHPHAKFGPRLAKSIAKRATGTLTAQWPDVLAIPHVAAGLSDNEHGTISIPGSHIAQESGHSESARSLRRLHGKLGDMAGNAKRGGDVQRHAVLVEVLRLIHREYLG